MAPGGLLKLEIKVQVPGSSPRDAEFETSCSLSSARAPSRRPGKLESENSQQKLNSTLRMQFSKNALVHAVELIGFEPTTSSLQSWRSPS